MYKQVDMGMCTCKYTHRYAYMLCVYVDVSLNRCAKASAAMNPLGGCASDLAVVIFPFFCLLENYQTEAMGK